MDKAWDEPGELEVKGWLPTGGGVLVTKELEGSLDLTELVLVPITGELPRRIALDTRQLPVGYQPLSVHPDGQRLVYVRGQKTHEVWALENFLPPPNRTR